VSNVIAVIEASIFYLLGGMPSRRKCSGSSAGAEFVRPAPVMCSRAYMNARGNDPVCHKGGIYVAGVVSDGCDELGWSACALPDEFDPLTGRMLGNFPQTMITWA
jgi:hypothetical protein